MYVLLQRTTSLSCLLLIRDLYSELTGRVECTYEGRSTDRDKEWFDEWRLGVHEVLLAGDGQRGY